MMLTSVSTDTFFKRATAVAEHYGFRAVDALPGAEGDTNDMHAIAAASTAAGLDRRVIAEALKRYAGTMEMRKKHPLMFYVPSFVSVPHAPQDRLSAFTLNMIGLHDPLSEIVVLKCAISILEDLGVKDAVLHINSIGDRDSIARYMREVGVHLKQRASELPPPLAERLRAGPGEVLRVLHEERHEMVDSLPRPIDFLTTPSRKYFKELLELLEHTNIPFELNERLYGDHTMYAHTLFEYVASTGTRGAPEQTTLARGGRYDNLTRAYARHTIPSVGIALVSGTHDRGESVASGKPRAKKPCACLVHIGREARIKSIHLLERFRREKVPIEQCLYVERFSEQVAYAHACNTQYVVIMGQREAHDGVAIVRNETDRSQRTVSLDSLPAYLKALGAEECRTSERRQRVRVAKGGVCCTA